MNRENKYDDDEEEEAIYALKNLIKFHGKTDNEYLIRERCEAIIDAISSRTLNGDTLTFIANCNYGDIKKIVESGDYDNI